MAGKQNKDEEIKARRAANQEILDGLVAQFGEEKGSELYEEIVLARRLTEAGTSFTPVSDVNLMQAERATVKALHQMPHVWIRIPAMQEDPDPDGEVYVGLNEHGYHIRKGQRVCVPVAVTEILKNAVVEGTVPGKDQYGRPRRVRYQRIPWQYEGEATPEEAAAFRAEMARAAHNELPEPSDQPSFDLPAELQ